MLYIVAIFILIVAVFVLTVLRGAPYVPTHRSAIKKLFGETIQLTPQDVVLDIGCGDGVVLREAARRGARAIGYEINPFLVVVAKLLSWHTRTKVDVRWADFWLKPFPDDTTIVYTFGESRDIQKMYTTVAKEATRLQKDITFISYGFSVPHAVPVEPVNGFYVYAVTPLQSE